MQTINKQQPGLAVAAANQTDASAKEQANAAVPANPLPASAPDAAAEALLNISLTSSSPRGSATEPVFSEASLKTAPTAAALALPHDPAMGSKPMKADWFPGFVPVAPRAGAAEGRQLRLAKSGAKQTAGNTGATLRPPVPSAEPQLTGVT